MRFQDCGIFSVQPIERAQTMIDEIQGWRHTSHCA
jgi:hypothetical protein